MKKLVILMLLACTMTIAQEKPYKKTVHTIEYKKKVYPIYKHKRGGYFIILKDWKGKAYWQPVEHAFNKILTKNTSVS